MSNKLQEFHAKTCLQLITWTVLLTFKKVNKLSQHFFVFLVYDTYRKSTSLFHLCISYAIPISLSFLSIIGEKCERWNEAKSSAWIANYRLFSKVVLVLRKVAWADSLVITITTQESAHATLRSTRKTLLFPVVILSWLDTDFIEILSQFLRNSWRFPK